MSAEGAFQKCDPKIEILEKFDWPDPNDPGLYEGLKERAEALRRNCDCAIILNIPGGIVQQGFAMRGFSEWLMDLYENVEFASRFMEILCGIWIKIAEKVLDTVGDNVDVIRWGDDLGMQTSTLVSPQVYRTLIKPLHQRMVSTVKSRSNARLLLHSCGSVYSIIEDFIEVGIDALNPVQVSARNMDPVRLKREFGDRMVFWGAIDTHRILPFGSPEEVREEVRRIIDCMGKGGGYILASVQTIQAEVPPENIVAMFEEGKSHGQHKY